MDLIRNDKETAAPSNLIAAQAVEFYDFFSFGVESVGAPKNSKASLRNIARVRNLAAGEAIIRRADELCERVGTDAQLRSASGARRRAPAESVLPGGAERARG
jgi:hypothetical protein